jgi:2-isopropylmalate synthase
MELFVMNALLAGVPARWNAEALTPYCVAASRSLDRPIPKSHPFFGEDAFRTTTGTHASAIMKAEERGDAWLADHVYGSVSASKFGRKQEIGIGAMSGMANVLHWMKHHGVAPSQELARQILLRAKAADRALTDRELWNLVRGHYGTLSGSESGDGDEQTRHRTS